MEGLKKQNKKNNQTKQNKNRHPHNSTYFTFQKEKH